MKIAQVEVWVVSVVCPECGEEVSDPKCGSLQWVVYEIEGRVQVCNVCGKEFKLPLSVKGVLARSNP